MTWRPTLAAMLALVVHTGLSAVAAPALQHPRGLLSTAPRVGNGASCTIGSQPLAFGSYDPLSGAPVHAITRVAYTCEDNRERQRVNKVRIELSRGLANSYDRAMRGPGLDNLRYQIYLDAAYTTVWGDGSDRTDFYLDRDPPAETTVNVPVYAVIFGLQDVPDGLYVDNITVTIQF